MPIVFLPSGISRIIPSNLDDKDNYLAENYYRREYSLKEKNRASRDKIKENSPENGASSETEIADESEDCLPEMSIDDDDQLSDDTGQKNKGISPTPSNSGAGANAKTLKVYQSHVRVFKGTALTSLY